MRASILLFATTLVFTSFGLNYTQNQQLSSSGSSNSVLLASYGNQRCKNRCRQYRGSGRRDGLALNNNSHGTLV
jgi:hypothetical protein